MSERLVPTIRNIAKGIAEGRFRSEAEISQGVVKQIFYELSWPQFDMQVVVPEFKIGDGARKVDYALCDPPGKAAILVEVKDLGKADEKGQKQLFDYCVHQGVPIAVLTDGRIWNFFYPPGQGDYDDRLLKRIDFLDDNHRESAKVLVRYLDMGSVRSHKARKQAAEDYEKAWFQKQAVSKFETVWRRLLSEPAESLLLDLFLEEVEKEMGTRPDAEQAVAFIRKQAMGGGTIPTMSKAKSEAVGKQRHNQPATSPSTHWKPNPPPPIAIPGIRNTSRQSSFTFRGQTQAFNSANELLGALFSMFAEMDPYFCRKYSERYNGRTKKYVAKTQEELNPGRPDLRNALPLPGGWYISTHCSNKQKMQWIRKACSLLDLEFGRDLVVNLPNA